MNRSPPAETSFSSRLIADLECEFPQLEFRSLLDLFKHLGAGQFPILAQALRAIRRIRLNVSWLDSELGQFLDLEELDTATQRLLERFPPHPLKLSPSQFPIVTALDGEVPDLEPLRGVLLVVGLSHFGGRESPSHKQITDLAQLIRSIETGRGRRRTLRSTVFQLQGGEDLDSVVNLFCNAISEVEANRKTDRFPFRVWRSWPAKRLETIATPPPIVPPSHGTPPASETAPGKQDVSEAREAATRKRRGYRVRKAKALVRHDSVRRISIPRGTSGRRVPPSETDDTIVAQEPLEETLPSPQFVTRDPTRVTTKKGRSAYPTADLTRTEQRALCFQAIRQRNSDMLPEHIEVLQAQEQNHVVPVIIATAISAISAGKVRTATSCLGYLTVLALGRPDGIVSEIPLLNTSPTAPPDDLEIILDQGIVRQPVFRPESAARPKLQDGEPSPFEPTQEWMTLPLPPCLMDALRSFAVKFPCQRLSDHLGKVSLETSIRRMFVQTFGKSAWELTRSVARARRWMPVAILEAGHDVAATMLIVGDTFGKSTAPLYYYAPRHDHLQSIYRNAIWTAFGNAPPKEAPPDPSRVGSELLLKAHVLACALRHFHRRIDHALKRANDRSLKSSIALHNLLMSYCLLQFRLITSHRPTQALFEITLNDLDLRLGIAIFGDKKVDAAHLWRAVIMSERLCRQIEQLLIHLQGLASIQTLPDSAAKAATLALAGDGPLFFFLDEGGQPRSGFDHHKATLPDVLQDLPSNWNRHFLATSLREAGAEPWLVMTQCGHLDAAGYPFDSASITSPAHIAGALRPALGNLEDSLGFKLRRGLGGNVQARSIPSLRSWRRELADHDRRCRAVEFDRLRKIAAYRKQNRDAGKQLALALLQRLQPDLHRLALQDLDGNAKVETALQQTVTLTTDDCAVLIEAIEVADQPDVIRLAAREWLSRLLHRIHRTRESKLATISGVFLQPSPEATPLFPGMLLATRQIHALRQAMLVRTKVRDESGEKTESRAETIRKSSPKLFKAMVLVLYQLVTNEEELRRYLKAGEIMGHVLVGSRTLLISTEERHPIALGLSGLAGVGYRSINHAETLDDAKSLDQGLRTHFPTFFLDVKPGTELRALLQTADVAARLELSGWARMMASDKGSTPASYSLQRALLVPGAILCEKNDLPELPETARSPDAELIETLPDDDEEDVEADPAAIRAATRIKKKILQCCGSGTVPEPTKAEVRKSLSSLIETLTEGQITLIVERALALFALHMAVHGTTESDDPALSTIRNYISAIGTPLIRLLAGRDLRHIDGEEFQEIYLSFIEPITTPRSAARAARECLNLHRILEREGVEAVERSEFADYLAAGDANVTADAVTSKEIELALRWLSTSAEQPAPDPCSGTQTRRHLRIARLTLILLRASGCRISEIVLLRHSDVIVIGSCILLVIRQNRYRRVKTAAGRRILNLTGELSHEEARDFRDWIEGERIRLGNDFRRGRLLFPLVTKQSNRASLSLLRALIKQAFRIGANRDAWPHLVRHYRAHHGLSKTITNPERLTDPTAWTHANRQMHRVRTAMGHASIRTTGVCYFHLPWMARDVEARLLFSRGDRKLLEAISGLSTIHVDTIRRRLPAGTIDYDIAWPEKIACRSIRPLGPGQFEAKQTFAAIDRRTMGLLALDQLLESATTRQDFRTLGQVCGLSGAQVIQLETRCDSLADLTRYRLLPAQDEGGPDRTPVARKINIHGLGVLESKLDQADPDTRRQLALLTLCCYSNRAGARENAFAGKAREIMKFKSVLERLGITGLDIVTPQSVRNDGRLGLAFSEPGISGFDRLVRLLMLTVVTDGSLVH